MYIFNSIRRILNLWRKAMYFLENKTKTKNKIKKIWKFQLYAGKISVQLEDKYYKNGENAQIQKIYDNFYLKK